MPALVHLLLPPARTRKDIGSLGLADDDGKRMFAPVTYKPPDQSRWEIGRLLPSGDSGRSHLIPFLSGRVPVRCGRRERGADLGGVCSIPGVPDRLAVLKNERSTTRATC